MKGNFNHYLPAGIIGFKRYVFARTEMLRFMFGKYCVGYQIGDLPHVDPEGGAFLAERLRSTKVYLEYGGGGSTALAARHVDYLLSVDSDKYFVKAIRKKLAKMQCPQLTAELMHSDIGITGPWGVPIRRCLSPRRLTMWEAYARAPWDTLGRLNLKPDTVFIDGRFRVACALVSLLNFDDNSENLIIIDDYVGRGYYRTVEDFADLVAIRGRMAILKKSATFDKERCERLCEVYFRDWR